MTRRVLKFGGTSVATLERMERVADIIVSLQQQSYELVVVVSAQAGETNRLIQRSFDITANPCAREYDALLATAEQASAASLAMILCSRGVASQSLSGVQAGIRTNSQHKRAHIESIQTDKLECLLHNKVIPVVTGFQGVNDDGDVTTLGRGGSDTTAVALTHALGAELCMLFTDVDGIYTADPHLVPGAQRLHTLSYKALQALCSLGSRVIHERALTRAVAHNIRLRILSTMTADNFDCDGTEITIHDNFIHSLVGLAVDTNQALIQFESITDVAAEAYRKQLQASSIDSDVFYRCDDRLYVSMHQDDFYEASQQAALLRKRYDGIILREQKIMTKLTIVGSMVLQQPRELLSLYQTMSRKYGVETYCYFIDTACFQVCLRVDNLANFVSDMHELLVQEDSAAD